MNPASPNHRNTPMTPVWLVQFELPDTLAHVPRRDRPKQLTLYFTSLMETLKPALATTDLEIVHANKHMLSLAVSGSSEAVDRFRQQLVSAAIAATITPNRIVARGSAISHIR